MQTIIIFDLSLIKGIRPGEIVNPKLNQIQKICIEGEHAWRLTSVVGCRCGSAKNRKGGLKAVKQRNDGDNHIQRDLPWKNKCVSRCL